jgi:NAD(P)-dependent dehydrogenase (short-subunit alcohol dehydrogenase family)
MTQKIVLVTGTSSGIGLATAKILAEHGYTVFSTVRKMSDEQQLTGFPNLTPLIMDVTDGDSIKKAINKVQAKLKPADEVVGLVNNAGIAVSGPLGYMALEEIRIQFEVNVIGLLAVTQAFLPLLRAGNIPGRVINLSSVAGRVASPFLGAYAASKHAVEAISDALRRELMPFGIKVVVIQPGPIATPIWTKGKATADLYTETPYRPVLKGVQKYFISQGEAGLPPTAVAKVVLTALEHPNPNSRYLVTQNKAEVYLSRLLPDKILDRMIFRAMHFERITNQ